MFMTPDEYLTRAVIEGKVKQAIIYPAQLRPDATQREQANYYYNRTFAHAQSAQHAATRAAQHAISAYVYSQVINNPESSAEESINALKSLAHYREHTNEEARRALDDMIATAYNTERAAYIAASAPSDADIAACASLSAQQLTDAANALARAVIAQHKAHATPSAP